MIVSDASPLIYLAKINRLDLLYDIFETVHIPERVRVEVVDRGKELGESDALIIENAIESGWIEVSQVEPLKVPIELEEGEIAALSLAKRMGIEEVLVDEVPARKAARMLDLRPRGTLYVLLKDVERGKTSLDGFLEVLDELAGEGFRLKEEVYLKAVKKAREYSRWREHDDCPG
ncbi:hypothetical protein AKJ63_01510 [candidate division MSBL1 archaeon SCGC-AAA259D18]|uniref:DUF3368 domain-containing protein n=2 Tax=candidate division MSBL1 TaxID=215777 RepID=A0A133U9R5_9EURY|nr:hypothetical protein AKJ57_03030 [candidate division MSBL1 archaeon SCGC-AAA259A05]KXA91407.1 hypothetical protein AKJ63_01510 [candidate division MSBL1 archaeon SCGC-AAA259D18]